MKPHILLRNSTSDLRKSNGPVELAPYQNCVFSNVCVSIQNSTRPSYHQIALRLGIIADHKVKPISVKSLMVVVLEDCE